MTTHRIAVVGGTGAQGKGLAYRFARGGHAVIVGSRNADRATATAHEINERLQGHPGAGAVTAATNADAATMSEVVILAIPYDGHDELVADLPLDGKVVISCVNPLGFDKRGAYGLAVDAGNGSAAESTQRLAPGARVVGAFHNVSAVHLQGEAALLDEDVIVVGDDTGAKEVAMELAAALSGRPGIDGGKLRLARQLEPLTAVLISINRRYKTHAGLRITGLHAEPVSATSY